MSQSPDLLPPDRFLLPFFIPRSSSQLLGFKILQLNHNGECTVIIQIPVRVFSSTIELCFELGSAPSAFSCPANGATNAFFTVLFADICVNSLSSATSRTSPPSWTASWSSASSPRLRPPPAFSSLRAASRSRTRPRFSLLALVSLTRTASVCPWASTPVTRS